MNKDLDYTAPVNAQKQEEIATTFQKDNVWQQGTTAFADAQPQAARQHAEYIVQRADAINNGKKKLTQIFDFMSGGKRPDMPELAFMEDERLQADPQGFDMVCGYEIANGFGMSVGDTVQAMMGQMDELDRKTAETRLAKCATEAEAANLLTSLVRQKADLVKKERDKAEAYRKQKISEVEETVNNMIFSPYTGETDVSMSPERMDTVMRAYNINVSQLANAISVARELRTATDPRSMAFAARIRKRVEGNPLAEEILQRSIMAKGTEAGKDAWSKTTYTIGESVKGMWNNLFANPLTSCGLGDLRARQQKGAALLGGEPVDEREELARDMAFWTSINQTYDFAVNGEMGKVNMADKIASNIAGFAGSLYEFTPTYALSLGAINAYNEHLGQATLEEQAGDRRKSLNTRDLELEAAGKAATDVAVLLGTGKVIGTAGKFGKGVTGRLLPGATKKAEGALTSSFAAEWAARTGYTFGLFQYGFPAATAAGYELVERALGKEGSWEQYMNTETGWDEYASNGLISLVIGAGASRGARVKREQQRQKEIQDRAQVTRNARREQQLANYAEEGRKIFGEKEAAKIFGASADEADILAKLEERMLNPELRPKVIDFLKAVDKDNKRAARVQEAAESGVMEAVLKQEGLLDKVDDGKGKWHMRFTRRDAEGKEKVEKVEWDKQDVQDWVSSRLAENTRRAVLEQQSLLRAEKLREAAKKQGSLITSLANFPREVLEKLSGRALTEGVLTQADLSAIARYAGKNLDAEFGSTGFRGRDLADIGMRGEERVDFEVGTQDKRGQAVFPAFTLKSSAGDMIQYMAEGSLTEGEMLHELLEARVRRAIEAAPNGTKDIISMLDFIQADVQKRNKKAERLLPDKPLEEMTDMDAVEGMVKLAQLDFLADHESVDGLSPATHAALDAVLDSMGETRLLSQVAREARRLAEKAEKDGKDGAALINSILRNAGLDMQRSYKDAAKIGGDAALEVVKKRAELFSKEKRGGFDAKAKAARVDELAGKQEHTKPGPTAGTSMKDAPAPDKATYDSIPKPTAEANYQGEKIPAEDTLHGEEIPAERNRPADPVNQETGKYTPPLGVELKGGKGDFKGRGLVGGKYMEMEDSSIVGTTKIENLRMATKVTEETYRKAVAAERTRQPVTIIRAKRGTMWVIGGLSRIAECKANGGNFVDVRIYDATLQGRWRDEMKRKTEAYLISIDAMTEAEMVQHFNKNQVDAASAVTSGILPREKDGAVKQVAWNALEATMEDWLRSEAQRRGATFAVRFIDAYADLETTANKDYLYVLNKAVDNAVKRADGMLRVQVKGKGMPRLSTENLLKSVNAAEDGITAANVGEVMHKRIGNAISDIMTFLNGLSTDARGFSAEQGAKGGMTAADFLWDAHNKKKGEPLEWTDAISLKRRQEIQNASGTARDKLIMETFVEVVIPQVRDIAANYEGEQKNRQYQWARQQVEETAPEYNKGMKSKASVNIEDWERAKRAVQYMGMSEAEASSVIESAKNRLKAAEDAVNAIGSNPAMESQAFSAREELRAASAELAFANTFAGARNGTFEDVANAVQSVRKMLLGGYTKYKEAQELKRQDAEDLQNAIKAQTGGINPVNIANKENRRERNTWLRLVGDLLVGSRSFYQLLYSYGKRGALGKAFEKFQNMAMPETAQREIHESQMAQAFTDRVKQAGGLDFLNRMKKVEHSGITLESWANTDKPHRDFSVSELKRILALSEEERNKERESWKGSTTPHYYPSESALERAKKELRDMEGTEPFSITLWEKGEIDNSNVRSVDMEMSRAQGMYMLLTWEQPNRRKLMERQGWTEEHINQLKQWIGREGVEMAYWLRSHLNTLTPETAAVYERMTQCPFNAGKNYFPSNVDRESANRTGSGFDTTADFTVSGYGFLFDRVDHNLPLDFKADAFEVYISGIRSHLAFIHTAETNSFMREVLTDPVTAMAVKQITSPAVYKMLMEGLDARDNKFIPTTEMSGASKKLASKWNEMRARFYLAGSYIVALKQSSSFFNFLAAPEMKDEGVISSIGKTVSGLARALADASMAAAKGTAKGSQSIYSRMMHEPPEKLIGSLQDLNAHWDDAPMNPWKMYHTDLFQSRESKGYLYNLAAKRTGTRGNWAELVTEAALDKTLATDGIFNALGMTILYNEVYRKNKKANPSLTDAELREIAGDAVTRAMMLSSQPTAMEQRALMSVVNPDAFLINFLFCKSDILNKLAMFVANCRRQKDQHGMVSALTSSYLYLMPFAVTEQAIVTAQEYIVSDYGNTMSDDDRMAYFMQNTIFAAALAPSFDVMPFHADLVDAARKRWDLKLAHRGGAGQADGIVNETIAAGEGAARLAELGYDFAKAVFTDEQMPEWTAKDTWNTTSFLRSAAVTAGLFTGGSYYNAAADTVGLAAAATNLARPTIRREVEKAKHQKKKGKKRAKADGKSITSKGKKEKEAKRRNK